MNIEKKANSIVEGPSGTQKLGSDCLPSFYFHDAYLNMQKLFTGKFPGVWIRCN